MKPKIAQLVTEEHLIKFNQTNFIDTNWRELYATLSYHIISNIRFVNCDFRAINFSNSIIKNCTFVKCNFSDANLRGCTIENCNFIECDFSKTILSVASFITTIVSSNFDDSSLVGVSAVALTTKNCNFNNCNLTEGYFSFGSIESTRINNCRLYKASFNYCVFIKSTFAECILGNSDWIDVSFNVKNTEMPIIQVVGTGSEQRITTYLIDEDIVICGCFKGSLKEFEEKVNEEYTEEDFYWKQYNKVIELFQVTKKDYANNSENDW